jgi:cell division protein FtsN
MTRTDNEQEFVLGNRQLLSAFFVVVLLLGVFFVMGYIVGSNSKTENAAKKAAQAEPAPVAAADAPNRASAVQPDAASVPAEPSTPTAVQEEKPVPPVERPVERKKAVRTVAAEAEAEAPAERTAVRVESAAGHTYLQVSAVKRPAADSIVKTLKDKGFPALLSESSKPELFRVLVGPYSDTPGLSKAKSDLKAMGFDAVVAPGSK